MNESLDLLGVYNFNASRLILPQYLFTFDFEAGYLKIYLNDLILAYPNLAYIVAILYIFSIFFIRWLMTKREPFSLKTATVVWNASLLVINFLAVIRLFPHLKFVLLREHFFVSLCADRTFIHDEVCATWLVLFPFIKMLELGDTIFIVLQKRYLDSYYWCHHSIALIGSWYLYPFYPAVSLWLGLIISLSHIPVYAYAIVRSLDIFKIPPYVKFLLISCEMVTVLSGAIITAFVLYYQSKGGECYIDRLTTIFILVLFSSCCFLLGILVIKKRMYLKNKLNSKV